jgi:hypothetical protein
MSRYSSTVCVPCCQMPTSARSLPFSQDVHITRYKPLGLPLGDRTSHTRTGAEGGSYIGLGLGFSCHHLLVVEAPDKGRSNNRGLSTHGSLAGGLLALFTGLAPSAARTCRLAPALTDPPARCQAA